MNEYLKHLYHDFIRGKIAQEYMPFHYDGMVLGENILGGYYFVLATSFNGEYLEYYLLLENCKKPDWIKLVKLKENPQLYETFNRSALKKFLPKRAFQLLLNNGLYESYEAKISKYDNLTSIHRLNACLYTNISGLEIHHNNKNKSCNRITNLTPVEKDFHDKLDKLPEPEFTEVTGKLHNEFKKNLLKPKRNTLPNRDEIVFEVLILLWKGFSPVEIVKKLDRKIHKSKIYEIKQYYFYLSEFMDYLYNLIVKRIDDFYGIFDCQWEYIDDFNGDLAWWNSDYKSFVESIAKRLEIEYKNRLCIRNDAYY